jgi:hypothetical protein
VSDAVTVALRRRALSLLPKMRSGAVLRWRRETNFGGEEDGEPMFTNIEWVFGRPGQFFVSSFGSLETRVPWQRIRKMLLNRVWEATPSKAIGHVG